MTLHPLTVHTGMREEHLAAAHTRLIGQPKHAVAVGEDALDGVEMRLGLSA